MAISRCRVLRMIGFVAALLAFSGFCGDRVCAQYPGEELPNCTFAGGSDRILIDYSCTGEPFPLRYQCLFVKYDEATGRLYPFIDPNCLSEDNLAPAALSPYEPGVMVTLQTNTDGRLEVLFQQDGGLGAVLTGDRYCGSPGLNRFGVRFLTDSTDLETAGEGMGGDNVGEGIVVDTDGDRTADSVLLKINPVALAGSRARQVTRLLRSAAVVMTEPLTYYDDGDDHYWVIPCTDEVIYNPQRIFVPVDSMHNLSVQCGDESVMISSEAAVDGDGGCIEPIPTVTGWGYAGLMFLVLVSGVWTMRRTGFWRGLSKD